jgi:hypothetical protein
MLKTSPLLALALFSLISCVGCSERRSVAPLATETQQQSTIPPVAPENGAEGGTNFE